MPPPIQLFDDNDPIGDSAYLACRDHGTKRDVREALERAWGRFWRDLPEKPEQFVREFHRHFHQRAWELFLRSVLTDAGLKLEPSPEKGPDFCLRLPSGQRCWIEAVAPTPGEGPDGFPQPPPGQRIGMVPKDNNLILRYRQALEEKLRKLNGYKADGIVAPDDAYLIAISQGAIELSDLHDSDLPAMGRAVFPVGDTVLVVVPYSDAPPTVETLTREEVRKNNTSPVSTTFFLEARTEFVSGVLFARDAVWNVRDNWSAAESLGLIHRPDAKNPLPLGAIPTRCEMWVEGGELKHRGICARYGVYSRDAMTP